MAKRRVDDYEDSEEYIALKRAIGKRIRTLRIAKGLSAKESCGFGGNFYANYGVIEVRICERDAMSLDRIAKALVVPLVSLFEDGPPDDDGGRRRSGAFRATWTGPGNRWSRAREELAAGEFADLQGFVDATQETLSANAARGKLRRGRRKNRVARLVSWDVKSR